MPFHYTLYGLHVTSEMAIAGLRPADDDTTTPDVTIVYGMVPTAIADAKAGVTYSASAREFLLDMADVARYHVADGRQITIAPYPGVPDSTVRLFLLGSALGALLHQRGMLPMHASAIALDDMAILFAGASGAGKSTMAASLHQRGYPLIADDITVVYAGAQGRPIAAPAFPQMKLWAQSLTALDTPAEGLTRIRPELEKYTLPIGDGFQAAPLPIKKLYLLHAHNKPEIEIKPVTGMAKIRVLRTQVYHRRVMEYMGADSAHFAAITALAMHTPVAIVRRSSDLLRLDELIALLETDMRA